MSGYAYGRYLIDSGFYDITPEQEEEIYEAEEMARLQAHARDPDDEDYAREECDRRGINPDEICADGGVEAWMIIAKEKKSGGDRK